MQIDNVDVVDMIRTAKKSVMQNRHCAALFDKKGNMICKSHNMRINTWKENRKCLHAEMAVLRKYLRAYMPRSKDIYKMVIIRVGKDNKLQYSEPCVNCKKTLENLNIYYEYSEGNEGKIEV